METDHWRKEEEGIDKSSFSVSMDNSEQAIKLGVHGTPLPETVNKTKTSTGARISAPVEALSVKTGKETEVEKSHEVRVDSGSRIFFWMKIRSRF